MSSTDLIEKCPLSAPTVVDEALLQRLEYEDRIAKASIWLHKLIIRRIRLIESVTDWYLHPTETPPATRISTALNQSDCALCARLAYYCKMLKCYRQNEVPATYVETDVQLTHILLARLKVCNPNSEALSVIERKVGAFARMVNPKGSGLLQRNDYLVNITKFCDQIITLFGRVSDEFRLRENSQLGIITPTEMTAIQADVQSAAQEVKAAVAENAETLHRIDNRTKRLSQRRSGTRKFSIEVQEAAFHIWQAYKQHPSVLEASNSKPKYESVFNYAMKELQALGVSDASIFRRILIARSKRISKVQNKH